MGQEIRLEDDAQIVVIGGGPAGSFFAHHLLETAERLGRHLQVQIIERKREPVFALDTLQASCREGCNYCAGGISPRMADELLNSRLDPPEHVVQERVRTVTVQSEWKNIEMSLPEGRSMFTVFRGSRPVGRADRHSNFDSFLLGRAAAEGALVTTGEVSDVLRGTGGRMTVVYAQSQASERQQETVQADLVVFASGVNQVPGMKISSSLQASVLGRLMPGFEPPAVRKTLIFELEGDPASLLAVKGEVFFIDYGSGELEIEMSSLIPKGHYITGVLIGRTIDRADPIEYRDIAKTFMELPQIRRLVPRMSLLPTACMCGPNMAIGTARRACGDRVTVTGDLAVSRLYKDGIYSAFLTGRALADAVIRFGVDRSSLERAYWPTVRRISRDNIYGSAVFFLNRTVFSKPVLSRVVYQAILTERKSASRNKRRLETTLWKVVSGDDSYRNIFLSMLHPLALFRIVTGGVLVTIRNYFTELLLGLKWPMVPKYPTGVYRELVTAKREELAALGDPELFGIAPNIERMYSIKIKASSERIWRQLGKLGESDREFLKLRLITISRVEGSSNSVGSVIAYRVGRTPLKFSLGLESAVEYRRLLYRVRDGFARGGILVFDIDDAREDASTLLTIYVAFNFPRRRGLFSTASWTILRFLFPAFVHDVAWNHALCKLKQLAETLD